MQYSLYHPNFRKRRPQVLAEADYQCKRCGIKHHSFAMSSKSMELYIMYLHVAHVFAEDKQDPDAPLIALCPRHHWFYDHPRNNDKPDEGVADWEFIGLVHREILARTLILTT